VLLGNETRHSHVLLDCERGRILWQAEAPPPDALSVWSVQPFGGYVFQSGLEVTTGGPESRSSVRVIRALDIVSGRQVATWRATEAGFFTWEDIGRLMIRDGHLYYLTEHAFSELHPGDFSGLGWQPASSSKH
jgi:hypothetical protein